MKKLMLLLMMVLLVGTVSAFLNIKSFDEDIGNYGEIKIKDWLFLKKADYKLTDYEDSVINVWAEGEYTLHKKTHLFTGIFYKDIHGKKGNLRDVQFFVWNEKYETKYNPIYKKESCVMDYSYLVEGVEICSDLISNESYQEDVSDWVIYEKGMDLEASEGRWRLEAKKPINEKVDFVLESHGKEFTEWAWWHNSWNNKRQINITETSATTLNNYSVLLYIPFNATMQADFDDLRFTNGSEDTELGYWITNKTDSTFAWVYVKIPVLTASVITTIYMYYGNAGASAGSNIKTGFLFGDDFNDGSVDLSIWDVYLSSYINETGGELIVGGTGQPAGYYSNIRSDINFTNAPYEIVFTSEDTAGTNYGAVGFGGGSGWYGEAGVLYSYLSYDGASTKYRARLGNQTDIGSFSINTMKESSLIKYANGTILVSVDGVGIPTYNGNTPWTTGGFVNIGDWGGDAGSINLDWIYMNGWTSSEPTYLIGAEQENVIVPLVTLNFPVNSYNSTSATITFNGTASDDTKLENVSLYIDGILNETNSSGINDTDYIFIKIISQGNHNWTYEAWDNDSQVTTATTRIFSIDSIDPFLNVTAPSGITEFGILTVNETLTWNVSDTNLDTCWFNYNSANTTVTCGDNTTTFALTSQRSLTFYANDTFGRLVSNITTWDYNVFENSQEFVNETLEGVINTFTANVTIGGSNSIAVANLIYNGTSNIGSVSSSANDSILTIDFLAPLVNINTNLTFFWSLLLSDSQVINLTSHNQTVTTISLDNCLTNTVVLYNYTVVDEGNQSLLSNTTIELNINLLDETRQNYIFNFSSEYLNTNPFAVCMSENLTSSSYLIDSIVKYETINHSIEYYNIVNSTITNSTIPENITLYDLLLQDSTEFKITFKDQDFSFVENALIFIDRQYIAENNSFKTVELPKTDSNGQTIGHFVRNNVVYNIRAIKDGVVLGNFQNIIAFCEDFTIGNCQMVLEATPEESATFDYNEQLGIIFESTPTYNENTSSISFDFSSDDGSVKIVSMEVTRDDIFGNRSICNNTIASSSGTLSCSFSPSIDDSVLRVEVLVDGQPAVLSSVTLESSDYGNLGYVFWFILTFLFILIFGNSKTEVLIGLGVSLIGATALGVTKGDIIGLGSAGIWMLVIVILGIWKINKENPQ